MTMLRYDEGHGTVLAAALDRWAARDGTKADPAARRAANSAMDAIDAMLAGLHALRSRLVDEIRAADDQAAVRADDLLARCKEEPR